MMEIDLSETDTLRNVITYSVSPLFELAASLHVLAQASAALRDREWVTNTLQTLSSERLLAEWNYFRPVFLHSIPRFFDPVLTRGVMGVDEQYEYFVGVESGDFSESLLISLQHEPMEKTCPVVSHLQDDPELVKGRFILFLSSYWQILFAATWEQIAPTFLKEAEQIESALHDLDKIAFHLKSISKQIDVDRQAKVIRIVENNDDADPFQAEQLTLFPSLFFCADPSIRRRDKSVEVIYNCVNRMSID